MKCFIVTINPLLQQHCYWRPVYVVVSKEYLTNRHIILDLQNQHSLHCIDWNFRSNSLLFLRCVSEKLHHFCFCNNLVECNFWHSDTWTNIQQYKVCTAHRTWCVFLHYLDENELSKFHVFNNRYWFYFHKTSFVLNPNTAHLCLWRTFQALLWLLLT